MAELRQNYKELLKQYHSDNGGDLHIMQEINEAYDDVFAILRHCNETGEESIEQETEADKAFRAVLNHIASYDMEVEIIGNWIWCFNCYTYKDKLKTLGFKYAPKKQAWTWHYGKYTHNYKRAKYCSQKVYSLGSINYHLN